MTRRRERADSMSSSSNSSPPATARGDQVSILKGIGASDVVVTAGQLKLHNGSQL